MNPVVWNVILSAVVIILICTCYEIRLITQWRWYFLRQRRNRSGHDLAHSRTVLLVQGAAIIGEAESTAPPPCVPSRLTADLIALLPTSVWTDKKQCEAKERDGGEWFDEECVICQEAVACGEAITTLPCQHYYHQDCIHAWLLRRATCPKCRRDLTRDLIPDSHPPTHSEIVTSSSVVGELESSYLHRHSHLTDITVVSSLPHTEGGTRTEGGMDQHHAASLDMSVGSRDDPTSSAHRSAGSEGTAGGSRAAAAGGGSSGTGGLLCRVLMMMQREPTNTVGRSGVVAAPSPAVRSVRGGRRRGRAVSVGVVYATSSSSVNGGGAEGRSSSSDRAPQQTVAERGGTSSPVLPAPAASSSSSSNQSCETLQQTQRHTPHQRHAQQSSSAAQEHAEVVIHIADTQTNAASSSSCDTQVQSTHHCDGTDHVNTDSGSGAHQRGVEPVVLEGAAKEGSSHDNQSGSQTFERSQESTAESSAGAVSGKVDTGKGGNTKPQ